VRSLALVLAALVLAGCGGKHAAAPNIPPPPPFDQRCGVKTDSTARSLWFRATDGTLLDGVELGEGARGVILLHQSPNDLCGWALYAPILARQGFHLLLVDLRAFGLSHRGPYGGRRGAEADVRGAVDELKELGAEKVALVGASYGGVAELVAAPALDSDVAGVASLSGELALPNSQLDALRAVPDLTAPLLVMGSREDGSLDERDARRLVRAAGSEQKSLVEFDGELHGWDLLYNEETKTRANRLLVEFLRRVTE